MAKNLQGPIIKRCTTVEEMLWLTTCVLHRLPRINDSPALCAVLSDRSGLEGVGYVAASQPDYTAVKSIAKVHTSDASQHSLQLTAAGAAVQAFPDCLGR